MKTLLSFALLFGIALGHQALVDAHCEVPCGIFDDGARFAAMKEDSTTIAKAIAGVQDLAGTPNPDNINQMVRWVTTKEDHANKIQETIAQYFMAQRIKPEAANYVEQLTKAHAVMVAAMKCKQAAEPAQSKLSIRQSMNSSRPTVMGRERFALSQKICASTAGRPGIAIPGRFLIVRAEPFYF